MEFARNIEGEPYSRKERRRFEAVREVLSGLTKQVVHEPIPAMSDHYRQPEVHQEVGLENVVSIVDRLNRPDDVA